MVNMDIHVGCALFWKKENLLSNVIGIVFYSELLNCSHDCLFQFQGSISE